MSRLVHLSRIRHLRRTFTPLWDPVEGRLFVMTPPSFSTTELMMSAQRACLYEVPWLYLQERMYNTGWKTEQGVRDNLGLLSRYLKDHWDDQTRLWRALMLLTDVRWSYMASRLIGTNVDQLVMAARTKVRSSHSQTLFDDTGTYYSVPTKEEIHNDWQELNPVAQQNIVARLRKTANARHAHRSEITRFLETVGVV